MFFFVQEERKETNLKRLQRLMGNQSDDLFFVVVVAFFCMITKLVIYSDCLSSFLNDMHRSQSRYVPSEINMRKSLYV